MKRNIEDYGLDLHCNMILEEYREQSHVFTKIRDVVLDSLRKAIDERGLFITAVEGRVKAEESLVGKLELKGYKYAALSDITDIVGTRVVTFYTDDVDKVAVIAENLFEIDWHNSVDKRKMHELDSFGYMSLHYICRIPKSLYYDPDNPRINEYRFEVQLRTTLQHMWAVMHHDIGYKSGVEVPKEHLRNLNRLAGVLELADDEFSRLRTSINDYRRRVKELVSNGNFSEVSLNGDTFRSYLNLRPFDNLNRRIAAINQAEIHETTLMPYLAVFKYLHFETLADIDNLIKTESDDAFQLAVYQIGDTDIDIIASNVAVLNLCVVYMLRKGAGIEELTELFESLNGPSDYNRIRASRIIEKSSKLSFSKK